MVGAKEIMTFPWQKTKSGKSPIVSSDFILEAIQDGVVMVGPDNVIRVFNQSAAAITGWRVQEAKGLDYKSVIKFIDQQGQLLPDNNNPISKAIFTGQAVRDNNASISSKSGKPVAVSLIVSQVLDIAGHPSGNVVGVFRDVSKEREEEKRRTDFINTASHEMRTPLAAIEGYLALALNTKTATVDEKARNLLQKASTATTHLGELFRDLLTSSKAEDGRLISYPVVVEVGEALEQVTEAARFKAHEKGLELRFVISSEQNSSAGKAIRPLYFVHVDPNRIREVFQNIIDNAIKYTMNGHVEVRLTGDSTITQIQVKDTGEGIPAEDIPHLFQKFYRVDNSTTRTVGGTGLGLFICRKIVELYNGRLWVESQPGIGSTFFLNLPRLNTAQAAEIQKNERSTVSPLDNHG